jgi:hypothetical protein
MWPVPSVEPGGDVDVVYYESEEAPSAANPECIVDLGPLSPTVELFRVGAANSLVDTIRVQSTDGGGIFRSPMKVTTATSNWCTTASDLVPNFGDYIGGASGANRAFPIWADGRNGIPDTFFAPIKGK